MMMMVVMMIVPMSSSANPLPFPVCHLPEAAVDVLSSTGKAMQGAQLQ